MASAITIVYDNSVGAESPIVLTGSDIGSDLGRICRLDHKTLMLLIGCGASAAVAGIFKAPIAGLVFTLEVLMIDLTMASLLPLLVSCLTATCLTYALTGTEAMFSFDLINPFTVERVPTAILLGIFCGLISLYFTRTMNSFEQVFGRIKNLYAKVALGGSVLALLIYFFPPLYGEGYEAITELLKGDPSTLLDGSVFYSLRNNVWFVILFLFLIILTKVFATSATNGGGGCGGTFAPSLFIGAYVGFLFARLWNMYEIGIYVPEKNFVLLGMAAVMAGVMHAPLTGIFLIAEITGGYQMFIPLMIVSICSYLTIIIFEPHSIYGMRLARQGKLITHHTDKAILTLMNIDSVIDKNISHVPEDMDLGALVHAISRSHTTILPVLDEGGKFMGEIDMSKLRHIIFRTELYHHFKVKQLISQPPCVLSVNDPMETVMKNFDQTDAGMLPVLETDGTLRGYVSRSHLYSTYRKMVADMSAE